jgi:hypothetical protein
LTQWAVMPHLFEPIIFRISPDDLGIWNDRQIVAR